jgi:hypothetical protein
MAEDKEEKSAPSPLKDFKRKLMDKAALKATITEGLKDKSAKVRALAIKSAFKLKDHGFIKQNVLGLIKSDKSKKVWRALSSQVTRKDLLKKVRDGRVKKKMGAAKPAEGEAAAAAPAPAAPAKT